MKDCSMTLMDPVRLKALDETKMMGSAKEEPFQRLNRLAATILKAPFSIFSLIDESNQFFKSAFGIEPGAMLPVDVSVCKYAFTGEPLKLEDTKNHPLFVDNKVVQDMNIRGYLGVPVTTTDGQIIGTLCVFDQTTRQWSQEDIECLKIIANSVLSEIELKTALRISQSSLHQREEFMSVASHEMKSPLTTLRMQSQLAQRQIAKGRSSEATHIETLKTFDRQFMRLGRLVDDMFDVSRMNTGKFTIHTEAMDLDQLVANIVENYSGQLQESGNAVTFERTGPMSGHWDPFRLEQVIVNILGNAMKYAPRSPVDIGLKRADGKVVLTIADKGPGMTPETQKKIFQPFERFNSNVSVTGLGLGLYISQKIMQEHGGELLLSSAPDAGSSFSLILPG